MPERSERELLALLLRNQAETVAEVVGGCTEASGYSLTAAITATRLLSRTVDDTLHALVRQARDAGHTWKDIGDLLGTTRQGAQQRFGRPDEEGPMSEPSPPKDAAARALAIFTAFRDKRWADVRADFDERMRQGLSEEMLAASVPQMESAVGKLKEFGTPQVRLSGPNTIVDVPTTFERGQMNGRVVFDHEGKVAGFFMLNPGVP